ncbi:carboxymethylenebutenolidase [Plasticicumulans lactativorans]|uniref:Carboxymethylenebutenolidase n=1 Tax=Plasticicumulans lactativorans TaxID=1133106 RepID=A0A4V6NPK1_9GAMM|nr:dienelactone hydrolase family protein [Plasticicumulans lactativorans]TCO81659.1 carboxymethylenebutenolidase [Plasticicumulans lactativorans]
MTDTSHGGLTRRAFVTALAASGFALAVQPIAAETILTPADGLDTGTARIAVASGELPVYHARPAGRGDCPLILVVQEIFGVHEYIRDVCRRLARAGYAAIAPELYFRQGDVSQIADVQTILKDVVARVPDAQVLADLDACLAWAGTQKFADAGRAGITGFCWGGRIAWLYAAHNPRLQAAVAWYGRLEGASSANTPQQPLQLASTLTVPVLGLYGEADQGIPQDSIERMKAALAQGRSGSAFVVYPGASHAFHADYRPSYQQAAAEDGWKRLLAWFAAHGLAV